MNHAADHGSRPEIFDKKIFSQNNHIFASIWSKYASRLNITMNNWRITQILTVKETNLAYWNLFKNLISIHIFAIKDWKNQPPWAQNSCSGWGSNSRPSDYETDALPTALPRLQVKKVKIRKLDNISCETYFNKFVLALRTKTDMSKNWCTHGGTRTPNLRFRRPTPYPLGHAGNCY